MCVDSAVKPDEQGPVSVWPCHNQGGNQVLKNKKQMNVSLVIGRKLD